MLDKELISVMKKADMKVYRERLQELRARLRGDMNSMTDTALRKSSANGETASMPIHMAELGSDNYEQEFTLSLLATEENRLESIDEALDRIEKGTYGLCVHCEKVVPKTRLNAIPYTPLCIKCAEKRNNGTLELQDD